jgi:hypothetical protein
MAEEKDRRRELDERHESTYTFIVVSRRSFLSKHGGRQSNRIQDTEQAPHVPRRPARKERQSPYTDESELSLLNPSGRRHDAEGSGFSTTYPPRRTYARHDSQGNAVGMRIWYDQGESPPAPAYSINPFGFQRSGSMGWPTGYSTGTGEAHQTSPGARQ